jgi:hypothetical protein
MGLEGLVRRLRSRRDVWFEVVFQQSVAGIRRLGPFLGRRRVNPRNTMPV